MTKAEKLASLRAVDPQGKNILIQATIRRVEAMNDEQFTTYIEATAARMAGLRPQIQATAKRLAAEVFAKGN